MVATLGEMIEYRVEVAQIPRILHYEENPLGLDTLVLPTLWRRQNQIIACFVIFFVGDARAVRHDMRAADFGCCKSCHSRAAGSGGF